MAANVLHPLHPLPSFFKALAAPWAPWYSCVASSDMSTGSTALARKGELGEFEQLVLLAVLRLGAEAYAPEIGGVLEERAARDISRGTLYAALDRLETKGLLRWHVEAPTPDRSGSRRRRFEVTPSGVRALATSRRILFDMWEGLAHLLREQGT
jgi:PadR family transcriptional regulator, regulatory protein PadR